MMHSAVMFLNNEIWARKISAAVWLALGICAGMAEPVAAQPGQGESTAIVADPLQSISLDLLSATRDRPLFSPSRRPPPVIEATPAPPPPRLPPVVPLPPPNLTFFGTFESNEQLGANVQTGGNAAIVRFGSYIEGWRVTEISRHRLVLSLDDRTAVFTLFGSKGPASQLTINHTMRAGEPQPRLEVAGQNADKAIDNHRPTP
jgi:general secretion pathway protein N